MASLKFERSNNRVLLIFVLGLFAAPLGTCIGQDAPKRPVDGIMDNSFLIEEAYNQEDGVVQEIFNGVHSLDKFSGRGGRRLDFAFTQEWPAYGQAHQLSYTVPYGSVRSSGSWRDGLEDLFLNYRYQAYFNEKTLTAFAPRLSLIIPTGDERRGFGNGNVGYQAGLPVSTALGDRWFVHGNAGMTLLPDTGPHGQNFENFSIGGSIIYCPSARFNVMLEWVGNWNENADFFGRLTRDFGSVLSPGARYAINFANGSQFVAGLGFPLGLNKNVPEIGAFLYLSFEHRVFGKARELLP